MNERLVSSKLLAVDGCLPAAGGAVVRRLAGHVERAVDAAVLCLADLGGPPVRRCGREDAKEPYYGEPYLGCIHADQGKFLPDKRKKQLPEVSEFSDNSNP